MRSYLKIASTALVGLFAFAGPSLAQERLILNYDDALFQGQNQTLGLKQELNRQHPGFNARNIQLNNVVVVAKSHQGQGSVELLVNGLSQDQSTISGSPDGWNRPGARTYDTVRLENHADSSGAWQLRFDGNIKVSRIMVFVDEDIRRRPRPPGRDYPDEDYYGGTDRIVLNFQGRAYSGTSTIRLKQLIDRQTRLDPRDYDVDRVVVYAKSRQGRGAIRLIVNNRNQDRAIVDGDPRDWNSNARRTYDRVELVNQDPDSRGTWQLQMVGNIRIDRVIVYLERDRRGRDRYRPRPRPGLPRDLVTVGDAQVDKVIGSRHVFRIANPNAHDLVLLGLDETVDVTSAYAVYRNGRTESLWELEGRLHEGQYKSARLSGFQVREVVIEAVSPNLIGSRGEYRLLMSRR